ncbi:MAG: ABC transporter permease [Treponema sp.]|nr:ABC transporter permease [Treponema sp.]
MEKAITSVYLAESNLRRKPYRTCALVLITFLLSFVLLSSFIFNSSLKKGIKGIQDRIGADLMIVPEGYETKAESVLLYGTPDYFYMDRSVEESVRKTDCWKNVTSQVYLTSVSESCCDFPVQIIGFNPETDFIVKTWAKNKFKIQEKENERGIFFAGNNVNVEKGMVRFFDSTHKITASLSKSGTGVDNVIYTDIDTLEKIFNDAKQKGFGFIAGDNLREKVSVIFIKIKEGSTPDSAALTIKNAVYNDFGDKEKIQIIQGEKFVSVLAERLSSILIFINASAFLVFITAFLSIAVVFSFSLNERIREFSILRVLGADSFKLKSIIFNEAFILGTAGSFTGIFFCLLIIIPFNTLISEKIGLPFSTGNFLEITVSALVVFVILLTSCIASAFISAVRISKFELYGEIK